MTNQFVILTALAPLAVVPWWHCQRKANSWPSQRTHHEYFARTLGQLSQPLKPPLASCIFVGRDAGRQSLNQIRVNRVRGHKTEVWIMNSILRTCGFLALAACATCLSVSDAQAGGRRWAYQDYPGYYGYSQPVYYGYQQPMYYGSNYGPTYTYWNGANWSTAPSNWAPAPVVANSNVTVNGRQRYQSGYQAPATVVSPAVTPAPIVNTAPVIVVDPARGPIPPGGAAPEDAFYNPVGAPNHALHFENRSFEEQNRADRKQRGL